MKIKKDFKLREICGGARQEQAEADLRIQGAVLDRQFEEMYRRIGGSKIIII